MVNNVPFSPLIPDKDVEAMSPVLEMYNYIIACKNLNLQISADTITPEDLDLISHIQVEIDKAHDAKRNRKSTKRR